MLWLIAFRSRGSAARSASSIFSQDGIKRTDERFVSAPAALLLGRVQAMEKFGGARVDWKLAASALGEVVLWRARNGDTAGSAETAAGGCACAQRALVTAWQQSWVQQLPSRLASCRDSEVREVWQ